jgi:2-keto-3-deoxy-L-rhamnonate aldolase RhmA
MTEIRNIAKERLEAGELALGVGLRQARTTDIAKIMKTAGFDWLFIDMEHSAISLDMASQISVTAQDVGITPIVRVPGFEHYHAAKALDGGAQGVVVPHVDDAETAAAMVSHCRYPPIGHRSVTGTLPQIDFASLPLGEATSAINASTLLILMIETGEAVANVEAIAATPGVDVLLVGSNDLSMELGIPGELDHPKMIEAFERILEACDRHGVHPGLGGIYQPPLIKRYVEMGFRLILTGSDLSFMLTGGKARAAEVRAMLG